MIRPMLCDVKADAFNDPKWVYERKFDGIRAIITLSGGKMVSIQARSGQEKLALFPDLDIKAGADCILDGEIVARTGKFNGIQHRANREYGVAEAARAYPAMFMCFDVLKVKDVNITNKTLSQRRRVLELFFKETESSRLSVWNTDGVALYACAETNQWEGIVGKNIDSFYSEGKRSPNWLKVKIPQRDVFWVVGYTAGTGWRASTFGALVLSRQPLLPFDFAGEVGTGFDQSEINRLASRLRPTNLPCVVHYPRPVTWVEPFPVKIKYLEFTADQKVRFPSYKGEITGPATEMAQKAKLWKEEGK
jgi:bifunctional non-homologous end joining protein LigD